MHSPLIRAGGAGCDGVCRAAEEPRARDLDRRAAALGRKLAKGLDTDEEEEEEEEDFYDVSEMEVSGIVFSPVKRYPWCAFLFCSRLSPWMESASSWGDLWDNRASLGILLLQHVGNLRSPMGPNRDCWGFAHSQGKGPGLLLLPLVGAQVHIHEQTCSPVLFFFAAAPDFAPHGTSLPPQPRRVSRYCNAGCASLQLPLATQPVPHWQPGLLQLPYMLVRPLARRRPLALCGFPGQGVRLPEQPASVSAGSSIASPEQKFFLGQVVGYGCTVSCTARCAELRRNPGRAGVCQLAQGLAWSPRDICGTWLGVGAAAGLSWTCQEAGVKLWLWLMLRHQVYMKPLWSLEMEFSPIFCPADFRAARSAWLWI